MNLSFSDLSKQDQLSFLMKNQNKPMELRDIVPVTEQRCLGYFSEVRKPTKEVNVSDVCETQRGKITKVTL